MTTNENQSPLDIVFGLCGSLAGYVSFLSQLTAGTRIGFDDYTALGDVDDIGQTWTPDIEASEIDDVELTTYNDDAIDKAPYNTNLESIQAAVDWGNDIIDSMFERDDWTDFDETADDTVSDELKHYIDFNQTLIDAALDLSGSISGLIELLDSIPEGTRVGFDDFPYIWEDVSDISQSWTPDVEDTKLVVDVTVYSTKARKKLPYSTDIESLATPIAWGNTFLSDYYSSDGQYAIDTYEDYAIDTYEIHATT